MRHGSYMLYSSKNKIKRKKYSSVIDLSKCIFQRNFGEIPVPILWRDPHVLGCPTVLGNQSPPSFRSDVVMHVDSTQCLTCLPGASHGNCVPDKR